MLTVSAHALMFTLPESIVGITGVSVRKKYLDAPIWFASGTFLAVAPAGAVTVTGILFCAKTKQVNRMEHNKSRICLLIS